MQASSIIAQRSMVRLGEREITTASKQASKHQASGQAKLSPGLSRLIDCVCPTELLLCTNRHPFLHLNHQPAASSAGPEFLLTGWLVAVAFPPRLICETEMHGVPANSRNGARQYVGICLSARLLAVHDDQLLIEMGVATLLVPTQHAIIVRTRLLHKSQLIPRLAGRWCSSPF